MKYSYIASWLVQKYVIFRGENEGSYFTIFWKGEECFQNETMDIFIAGEGNFYCLTGRGGWRERVFIGDATFLASGNFWAFGYIYYWPGDVQRICGWRVQYPTGIQVRYLSLDYCSLLYYGRNPRVSTSLVDGTLVLGFSVLRKRALFVAPSCSGVAPVRGVGDPGESGVPLWRGWIRGSFSGSR